MPKLHQILSVEAGIRSQTQKDLTEAHHGLQRAELMSGQYRTYQPINEDGEQYPPEHHILACRAPQVIRETIGILVKQYNVVATKDFGNMLAMADVVVDGKVLISNAPVPFLLWLDKKLDDLHKFIVSLPLTPADTEWEWDEKQDCFKNKDEIKTAKTKKVAYPLVLHGPTDKHPAQVSKETRDDLVGYWTTVKYSGGMKRSDVMELKGRVEKLQKAVKFAREQANAVEVADQHVGQPLLKYVFGKFAD